MMTQRAKIRDEQLFLLAYVLWLINAVIDITVWRKIELINVSGEYLEKTAFLLLLIKFLLKRHYTKKDAVGILIIIYTCVIAYRSVYNKYIIDTVILIYCSANVDFRKILKCTLIIHSAFMIVTVAASRMEVIENVVWESMGTESGARIRESLGYDYAAYPAHILLFLTVIWFCLREKTSVIEIIIAVLLNYIVYFFTDSRTDFYLSLLSLGGFWVICKGKRKYKSKRLYSMLLKKGFALFSLFSIIIHGVFNPDSSIMLFLDEKLTGRLSLGNSALKNYGITLFGRIIRWVGMGSIKEDSTLIYNYVDNAFLKELLSFGIIYYILLGVGFYIIGRNVLSELNERIGWSVIVSLIYAMFNAHICMPVFNVFVMLLGNVFYDTFHSTIRHGNCDTHKIWFK